MYELKLKLVRKKWNYVKDEELTFIPCCYYTLKNSFNAPVYQYFHHDEGDLYLTDIDTGEDLSFHYSNRNELDSIREMFKEVELRN